MKRLTKFVEKKIDSVMDRAMDQMVASMQDSFTVNSPNPTHPSDTARQPYPGYPTHPAPQSVSDSVAQPNSSTFPAPSPSHSDLQPSNPEQFAPRIEEKAERYAESLLKLMDSNAYERLLNPTVDTIEDAVRHAMEDASDCEVFPPSVPEQSPEQDHTRRRKHFNIRPRKVPPARPQRIPHSNEPTDMRTAQHSKKTSTGQKDVFSEVFADQHRDIFSDMSTNPFGNGQTAEANNAALRELEDEQKRNVGPQWRIESRLGVNLSLDIQTKFGEAGMAIVQKAMSGAESGGTQAALGGARYESVGDEVLHRMVVGISRIIDTSNGPNDVLELGAQISRGDGTAQAGASVASIRTGAVPIFAMCYAGDIRRTPGRGELLDLHTGLHVLTGGRRARIWLGCLAAHHFSRAARWLSIGLLPFALFPVICIGEQACMSPRVLCKQDAGWPSLQIALGEKCLGVIRVHKRKNEGMTLANLMRGVSAVSDIIADSTAIGPVLISRKNALVKKTMGFDKSVKDGLLVLADGSLRHKHLPYQTDHSELQSELRRLTLLILRNDSIQSIVLGIGNASNAYSLNGLQEAHVFAQLAKFASQAMCAPITSIGGQYGLGKKRKNGVTGVGNGDIDYPFWDGTSEFVDGIELARALRIQEIRRTYKCYREEGSARMYVFATLQASTALHGALLVDNVTSDPRRGVVTGIVSNIHGSACGWQASAKSQKITLSS